MTANQRGRDHADETAEVEDDEYEDYFSKQMEKDLNGIETYE